MSINKNACLSSVFALVFLSGCASTSSTSEEPAPRNLADDVPVTEVQEKIAQAVERSSKALQTLSEVKNAKAAGEMTFEEIRQANWRANYTPEGMGREVTINWSGPSKPILDTLAEMVDYDIIFLNEAAPIAHTVHIDAENEPVIDVIRKIDAQVNNVLTINIYEEAETKKIEVKYAD